MIKKYNQAPLPFMGQKRRFVKEVSKVITRCPSDAVYIDLFGGSGLLSHTVKYIHKDAKVIYNDFDDYSKRLDNIENTNLLLTDIRGILSTVERSKRVSNELKDKILARIIKEEKVIGFVDYLTISASILFSMNYANNFEELQKQTFYNTTRRSPYTAQGYLYGVDVVSLDYRELFKKYENEESVIFLVDPPYLSTEVKAYQSVNSWGIADYLDVLNVLNGTDYIYFTSNKSEIVELCEWIENRTFEGNPFKYATTATVNQTVNYSSSYTDIMLYKVD